MDMKIIKTENKLCTCCMEEHEVKTVCVKEHATFKNVKVDYEATYMFCEAAGELYADEQQLQDNDIKLKDAYRAGEGLLTSSQINGIRTKYKISQSDLCILLGWGGKTIARYETHQIQDKAHDTILKKIAQDPEWFLSLLNAAKPELSKEAFTKYKEVANDLYEENRDSYLRKSITASYAKYQDIPIFNGNTELSLDKVVDVIRYFASSKQVTSLYKVKLMKLMWYADALSYKKRGAAITGLVYKALPMGALPVGHDSIINLKGVPCEEVDIDDNSAYRFSLNGLQTFGSLTKDDKEILDIVIDELGKKSREDIVECMHSELAYRETKPRDIIRFEYANELSIG